MSALKLPPPVIVRTAAALPSQLGSSVTLLETAPRRHVPSVQPIAAANTQVPSAGPEATGARAMIASTAVTSATVTGATATSATLMNAASASPGARRVGAVEAAAAHPHQRQVDSPLFRYEALRAYKLGHRLSTPLQVVPLSTTLLLATLGIALLTGLALATFGQVDLTARGRGTIRSVEGVQPLLFEIEGVVRELLVHDGDVVRAGQVLLRLDSARLQAALLEAEEQLAAVRDRTAQEDAHARRTYARDSVLLERRARLTRSRIASQEGSVSDLDAERVRYVELAREGLVADKVLRESEQHLHQDRRALFTLQDELARIEQQVSSLEQGQRAGLTQRTHDVREAVNRRDTAKLLLQQTELRAARAGRVESLLVAPGDVIEAGRVVARLASLAADRSVTAFVPERERAFVHTGALVRIEFDQLPVGEFGSAAARVVRVATELASPPELERALGAAAPEGVHFAITLRMFDDAATRALLSRVGSGTLLSVRLPVRRRRILSLVLDPVRKWLD